MADPSLFELNNIDSFVQEEFKRRSSDIGFDYKQPFHPDYKGPRTAWVRVCSNTIDPDSGLHGFVMGGVNGFDDTYGFNSVMRRNPMLPSDKNNNSYTTGPATILGYDIYGSPHAIEESSFKHRPCPGVTGLDVELMGGAGKFRKTTIKWQCWSAEQLNYLENYFLIPTVSIFVEWGWNNFNPASLLDLKNVSQLKWMLEHEQNIKDLISRSNGNWDMSYGIITDFSYDLRDDGGYDVSTTISNPSQLYSAFSTKDTEVKQGGVVKVSPKEFVDIYFSNIISRVGKQPRFQPARAEKIVGNEDRVFYLSNDMTPPANQNELFYGDKSASWISFDLLVDIINFFYAKVEKKNHTRHCTIDISDTKICAHQNLKSNDATVLLIPNMAAPSGESITTDASELKDIRSGKRKDATAPANILLRKAGLSTNRVNLTEIICRSRKIKEDSGFEFPNYTLNSDGNSGYLKHLYVNSNLVKNAISTNESIVSALKQILDSMSKAACGIWDFEILPKDLYGITTTITVKDKNYIGDSSIEELTNDKNMYSFELTKSNSLVKNAKFNVKPSSAVTMQALLSNDSDESISTTPKNWLTFRNLDRMQASLKQADSNMPVSKAGSNKKELATNKIDSTYAIVKNAKGQDIRLCEPDQAVQKQILEDNNPHNNAVYNAIIPNTTLDITIRGISGLRFLDCFVVSSGLPKTYSKDNALFQIMNVRHSLSNGDWYTTINAGIRPKPSFFSLSAADKATK